jgi:RNA recognition motif-containing protein
MTVISSSPSHSPSHGGNTESSLPCSVAALSTPFIESLASPFFPKNLEPAYPPVGRDFNLYDTFAIPPASQWSEARQRGPAGTCDENINANLRNVLDPTTIFVGGLEVHGRCSWDEQRLRQVFGQYGEITEVKLVRPGAWIRLMMRSDAYFHISQPTGSQRSLL